MVGLRLDAARIPGSGGNLARLLLLLLPYSFGSRRSLVVTQSNCPRSDSISYSLSTPHTSARCTLRQQAFLGGLQWKRVMQPPAPQTDPLPLALSAKPSESRTLYVRRLDQCSLSLTLSTLYEPSSSPLAIGYGTDSTPHSTLMISLRSRGCPKASDCTSKPKAKQARDEAANVTANPLIVLRYESTLRKLSTRRRRFSHEALRALQSVQALHCLTAKGIGLPCRR